MLSDDTIPEKHPYCLQSANTPPPAKGPQDKIESVERCHQTPLPGFAIRTATEPAFRSTSRNTGRIPCDLSEGAVAKKIRSNTCEQVDKNSFSGVMGVNLADATKRLALPKPDVSGSISGPGLKVSKHLCFAFTQDAFTLFRISNVMHRPFTSAQTFLNQFEMYSTHYLHLDEHSVLFFRAPKARAWLLTLITLKKPLFPMRTMNYLLAVKRY
ncbi:hypothetical protein [Ruegeria sp. HKCCD7559]|uniref:hypothetical protein n=1 Tax=Ruegeria sp. HKCCD7559 TaxID=2683005 RepID=UPI001491CFB1|nr:hypothetical protein [Ruegeria sp. HKCCD7559]NOC47434.1 hypothetical protein [Ruegeria sp. HKCCD7559]